MITISWLEFHNCYRAAVMLDENKWQRLRISDHMLEQWEYADSGAIYVPPEMRSKENRADTMLTLFKYKTATQTLEIQ